MTYTILKRAPITKVSMILAQTQSGLIGQDDHMAWYCPLDFKWYKKQTLNKAIIMGANTARGMGDKFPLPGRANKVLTRNSADEFINKDAHVFTSLEEALDQCASAGHKEVVISGGLSLYQQAARMRIQRFRSSRRKPLVQKIYKTVLSDEDCVTGNVYLDPETSELISTPRYKIRAQQVFALQNGLYVPRSQHVSSNLIDLGQTNLTLKPGATPFSTISFEEWTYSHRVYGR